MKKVSLFLFITSFVLSLSTHAQSKLYKDARKVRAYRITGGALGIPQANGEFQFDSTQKFKLWMFVEDTVITLNNEAGTRYTLNSDYTDQTFENGSIVRTWKGKDEKNQPMVFKLMVGKHADEVVILAQYPDRAVMLFAGILPSTLSDIPGALFMR